MPNHDLVIVEGYRQSGLPVIEVLRQGNERDIPAAEQLCTEGHVRGVVPVAVVTDMGIGCVLCEERGDSLLRYRRREGVADFLQNRYAPPEAYGGYSGRRRVASHGPEQGNGAVPWAPLIERIVERVAPVADEIAITTNEAENLTFLDALDLRCDLRLVPPTWPQGARRTVGLYPALSAASNPALRLWRATWCSRRRR